MSKEMIDSLRKYDMFIFTNHYCFRRKDMSSSSNGIGVWLIIMVLAVVMLVGMWKLFVKAGKPGWGAIVPFYNLYCLYDMSFGNGWLFLLTFVPCANLIITIMLCFKIAKAFGQGAGFGVGLIFFYPIFMLILGFGSAEYVGPQ